MKEPRIGLKLPSIGNSGGMSAGDWGEYAESLGYDSLWVSEGWDTDAFLLLYQIAEKTHTIDLCTAVVNVFSRSPAVLAMAGSTLQNLTGRRVVLGVGPSHQNLIESLHGLDYERPVRRTHEAIEMIKLLTSGSDTVTYSGEIFQIEGYPGTEDPITVYNAALGEMNLRATGRVADGWLPYLFPISSLDRGFKTISEAAKAVGRTPDDIKATPQILAVVNEDIEAGKETIRSFIIRYIERFPNYRKSLAKWFPQEVEAVVTALETRGIEAATHNISDDMVFELGIVGPPADAQNQLENILRNPIIDRPIIYVPTTVESKIREQTIEVLSPGF